MSTVTLSQPHCAMTSAEKPLGMASQALTQALPACRRFFSMFDMSAFPRFRCGTPVLAALGRSRYASVAIALSLGGPHRAQLQGPFLANEIGVPVAPLMAVIDRHVVDRRIGRRRRHATRDVVAAGQQHLADRRLL